MRNFMLAIKPYLGGLSRISLYISGIGMIAMTLIVGWQVFGRYVLNDSPSWSEPLSLYLMSWFIMLGAAVGVRESVHLGLDIVRYVMPPAIQKAMDLLSLGLIVLFGIGMAYYSTLLAMGTWSATIPVLGWPGGTDFFPMIVGGAMISLFALERFVDVAIGEDVAADVLVQEAA
ncbi:TRAP transporter small permease [Neorhizobium galegae]|uniref:TRAP transporter small permease n=1 Tax=Neorhizobium galegae TaxID=399 RepID=UPI000620F3DF|nr:TRAP transporter small permease [Neorhizobium galegae]CDZ58230.1 TRAP-T family transporter, DctQ (4 TMs) subunit [Neorhizobium galegae bv. orientalis]KAB1124768.1 TRAP transporter small permease [Neorhizobium galegae]MCQ1806375.1 TRAP transporter small permease [Neorhizobium galegae]UIK03685.1 TRAP transporter small permease [Neorhizobium galegae]CDZ69826.1 TRAP-T family transporter, DctQ (4 TMs) subunit [Neorhizobium galegae bv. orientalis]